MSEAKPQETYECRASDCNRSFGTAQGRNVHESSKHDFDDDIGMFARNGVRSHLDEGETVIVSDRRHNVRRYHTVECGHLPAEENQTKIAKKVLKDANIPECESCQRKRKRQATGTKNRPRRTTKANKDYARHNYQLILSLPEPGEQFEHTDTDIPISEWCSITQTGILDKIVPHQRRKGNRCSIWETNKAYYEIAKQKKENEENGMLPCGHNAITNERGVDGITCKICGEVHDKDEI